MPPKAGPGKRASTKPSAAKAAESTSSPPPPRLEPIIAFYIFLVAHILAATFSPIQDCDEVFNYWEPTHYLNHGYGLQTWEYSPEYAIRSWLYAGLHAIVIGLARILSVNKAGEFYFLRIIFAFVCAASEARLYSTIQKTLNPRVAIFFLMIIVTSAGMFHASVAYLPSTFAMYCAMNGFSAFLDWQGGLRTAQGILWFGIGATLGWPFAGALVVPFIFEEIVYAARAREVIETLKRMVDGAVRCLIVLALQVSVDTFFYRKIAVVPWNIVIYNIFSGSGKGPDIYGTEPWHFYIRNLLINFNVWFVLALFSFPLLLWQHFVRRQIISKLSIIRSVVILCPFYMWLAIFTLQPHKEERFMYPAYPALALNAAISLHVILASFGSTDPRDIVGKIPPQIKLAIVSALVLAFVNLGFLRILALASGYSAPLKIYSPLHQTNVTLPGDFVCLGKEWYRFPSSYHLPEHVKAKFIKSEFRGLLPGEFSEANVGFGVYPGAWLIPSGMNDENKEDPSKYTDIAHCKFLVDSYFPGSTPSKLEPDYILDTDTWEPLKCEPFLDPARTGTIGRLIYIPDLPGVPDKYRRKWGEYCLLRRKEQTK